MNRNVDGQPYSYVKFINDRIDDDERTGKFYPQKLQSVTPNRVNILIDSEDREPTSKSDFDFTIRFDNEIFIRQIYLNDAILPLCPTINDKNNIMSVTVDGNTFNITLDNGFYNPVTFCNMLQSKFSTAWAANVDPAATVLCSYNNSGRYIQVEDTSPGGIGGPFTITFNSSPFSLYGLHVCEFKTGVASTIQKSISLEMIYSRYCYIKSYRLSQNQRCGTITSGHNSMDIIGIVFMADSYDESQYQSTIFPGTSRAFKLDKSPVINTTALTSFREVDIRVEDEFGFNLFSLLSDGSFQYGVVLNFCGDYY